MSLLQTANCTRTFLPCYGHYSFQTRLSRNSLALLFDQHHRVLFYLFPQSMQQPGFKKLELRSALATIYYHIITLLSTSATRNAISSAKTVSSFSHFYKTQLESIQRMDGVAKAASSLPLLRPFRLTTHGTTTTTADEKRCTYFVYRVGTC